MNGRDAISASLRLIGALAPGESLAASEASDGLASLNRMLDGWSTEELAIPSVTQETAIALSAGVSTYTLGALGSLTTRPMEIEAALVRSGSTDRPLKMISESEFAALANKSISSTYPQMLYDDGGYPQRTLTLYPVPSASLSLILFTKRALTAIATLDTVVSLPPGYERAIVYNLAIEIAPEYGRAIPDAVMAIAMESKAGIKRANHRAKYLRVDTALRPRKRYDIFTGDA